jgi:hypothetical protein
VENGLRGGLTTKRWQPYTPRWRSANFFGAAPTTQPSIGDGQLTGKWRRDESGLIVAQLGLTYGSTTDPGTGAQFHALSLPYPASRSNGGADLPIGSGYARKVNTGPLQPVIPTLADPASLGSGASGDEDNWLQGFCHRLYAAGVGGDANSPLFTSGATTVTVTHNLGLLGGFIPAISDIYVVATNAPSTNPRNLYVASPTATQFTLGVGASSTTTPITYAWKIVAEPNSSGPSILCGPNAPWQWSAGDMLTFGVAYEPRR